MKRYLFAMLALASLMLAPAFAQVNTANKSDRIVVAQAPGDTADYSRQPAKAPTTTNMQTTTETATPPASVTTTVKGGTLAAQVLEWFQVALVPIIGSVLVALFLKAMQWLGIQVTSQQSDQLQKIAVNGLNDAMVRAETSVKNNPNLSFEVKNGLVADAIAYTQDHAKETLTAMGLDPKSGKAVEAIRAKIATAINDPSVPTPPALTPKAAGGVA